MFPPDPVPTPVFKGSHKNTMEISLLLASQGIAHRIEYACAEVSAPLHPAASEDYCLFVEPEGTDNVRHLIDLYREENKGWRIPMPEAGEIKLLTSPLLFILPSMVVFYFQTNPLFNNILLTHLGRNDSDKLLAGEWWRAFTALTLHGGPQHFLSNMFSGYLLFNLLANRLNAGLAILAITLMGALGNYFTALNSGSRHLSIGFSTAVFACLGSLACIHAISLFKNRQPIKKTWAPLAAALFLVVFMGLGEDADVRAHFFGFFCGIGGTFLFYPLDTITRGPWVQICMGLAAYGLYALSWILALG